jgi:hypothetical protein
VRRLLLTWPTLLVRALDDLHQLARAAQHVQGVGEISKDIRELNRQLVKVEKQLAEIARPARTTDTIMRAMPGSKVVAARAKAQRERTRDAKDKAKKPKPPKPAGGS